MNKAEALFVPFSSPTGLTLSLQVRPFPVIPSFLPAANESSGLIRITSSPNETAGLPKGRGSLGLSGPTLLLGYESISMKANGQAARFRSR